MQVADELHDKLRSLMQDKAWRMENMYLILDENGKTIPLQLRGEQETFLRERHQRNFVPKARKLGMSTIILLDSMDSCIWNANYQAGHVDLSEKDAFDKLSIAKFAWENGPDHPNPEIAACWQLLHKANPLVKDSAGVNEWANGAKQTAGVSYTGKTPQRLHISEYGPISCQFPLKATRMKQGSMNAVPPDGILDIETTMEGGRFGECYAIFKMALEASGYDSLSKMDWKMHFFPWWNHPSYDLPGHKPHNSETKAYFDELKAEHQLFIPASRQAWYEKKKAEQGELMWQQFPSVISECDRHVAPGQIFTIMTELRSKGRIREFEKEPGAPIYTCWDIGASDNMAGWMVQPTRKDINWLEWTAGEGKGAPGVAEVIRGWQSQHGQISMHYVPHDAEQTDKGSGMTFVEQMVHCGIPRHSIQVVPRIPDKWVGIGQARQLLPNSWFHSRTDQEVKDEVGMENLPSGVGRLEGYRKKVNQQSGVFNEPVGDICSHTADALRTFAEAWARNLVSLDPDAIDSNRKPQVLAGYRGMA